MDIKLQSEDEEKKLEQISGESNEPDVKEGVVATTTEFNGKDVFWRQLDCILWQSTRLFTRSRSI